VFLGSVAADGAVVCETVSAFTFKVSTGLVGVEVFGEEEGIGESL
jgi:hypothetical protein